MHAIFNILWPTTCLESGEWCSMPPLHMKNCKFNWFGYQIFAMSIQLKYQELRDVRERRTMFKSLFKDDQFLTKLLQQSGIYISAPTGSMLQRFRDGKAVV